MAEAERKTTAGQHVPLSEEELARQLRREAAIFFPEQQCKAGTTVSFPPQQGLPEENEGTPEVLRQGPQSESKPLSASSLPGQGTVPSPFPQGRETLPPPFPQEKEMLGEGESDYDVRTAPAHVRKDGVLHEGESAYDAKTAPTHVRKNGVLQEGESAYEGAPLGSLADHSEPIDRTEIGDEGKEREAGSTGLLDRDALARGFKLAAVLGKPRSIKAWEEDEF